MNFRADLFFSQATPQTQSSHATLSRRASASCPLHLDTGGCGDWQAPNAPSTGRSRPRPDPRTPELRGGGFRTDSPRDPRIPPLAMTQGPGPTAPTSVSLLTIPVPVPVDPRRSPRRRGVHVDVGLLTSLLRLRIPCSYQRPAPRLRPTVSGSAERDAKWEDGAAWMWVPGVFLRNGREYIVLVN